MRQITSKHVEFPSESKMQKMITHWTLCYLTLHKLRPAFGHAVSALHPTSFLPTLPKYFQEWVRERVLLRPKSEIFSRDFEKFCWKFLAQIHYSCIFFKVRSMHLLFMYEVSRLAVFQAFKYSLAIFKIFIQSLNIIKGLSFLLTPARNLIIMMMFALSQE